MPIIQLQKYNLFLKWQNDFGKMLASMKVSAETTACAGSIDLKIT
jgi:hypothetical protein